MLPTSFLNRPTNGENEDGHKVRTPVGPFQSLTIYGLALQHDYAAGVWAVMNRFGQVLITEELNGNDIHRLENVITMASDKHLAFDQLKLWFEETVYSRLLHSIEIAAENLPDH
jgi:hypothetical protein